MRVHMEEIRDRLLLGGWSNQEHHFAETEIYNTMMRRNIDDSTFKLAFIVPPSEKSQDLLNDVKHENQAMGETNIHVDFMDSDYYDCKSILFGMIKYHMNTQKKDWVFMVFIFLGIVWGLSPGLARTMVGLTFAGNDELEVVIFFLGMLFYILMMIFISVFFITAYFDYDRVVFCLEQLSQMYSPDNLTHIKEKIMPTINLADAVSLQGWINIRKVLLSYGAPYFNRHKIFVPVILAVSGFSCLGVFTISAMNFDYTNEEIVRIQFPLAFTFVLFGGMFMMLLRKGQLINDQFKVHIELLRENQQIFQTFHHFRDYYIKEMDDKELPYQVNGIFQNDVQSYVHQKMAEEAKKLIGDKDHICNEYIEKLVEMQEEFITEIEKEYKFNAKTLFGFSINFAVVGIFFVAYCLIIFYGYFLVFDPLID